MSFTVYILYSQSLMKYYIGYSSLTIDERLKYHLSKHKGFTAKAKDWVVVYLIQLPNKTEAILLEKKIKKRGAKRYLNDLSG